MNLEPLKIAEEYQKGTDFQASMGTRGMKEQSKMNERFYIGDQWNGVRFGADRPLVRHNVIKRIGDYKMSQILSDRIAMGFSAEGISTAETEDGCSLSDTGKEKEIKKIMKLFSDYFQVSSERIHFTDLTEKAVLNAFLTGTAVLYTYWDSSVRTGLFADADGKIPVEGDISCEVLDACDVVFGDMYCQKVQEQPYIIIAGRYFVEDVLEKARANGVGEADLDAISQEGDDGKITLRTNVEGTLCKVTVSDNGPGIPAEDRGKIFDRFFTSDRAHTAGKGTGLGLPICQRILNMHGGEIRLLNTEEGAAFTFTLPAAQTFHSLPEGENAPAVE